jgi:hypothetical protein
MIVRNAPLCSEVVSIIYDLSGSGLPRPSDGGNLIVPELDKPVLAVARRLTGMDSAAEPSRIVDDDAAAVVVLDSEEWPRLARSGLDNRLWVLSAVPVNE